MQRSALSVIGSLGIIAWLGGCPDPFQTLPEAGVGDGPIVWPESGAPTCKAGQDTDGDGLRDEVEGCGASPVDTDGDKTPDYLDFDSDNDQLPDRIEGSADSDGDKTPDFRDVDSDGDGLGDGDEDRNHDGLLGCCLATCGEARKGCPEVKPDECGAGQKCTGGTCQPTADFLCSDGETDPRKPITFPGTKGDADLPNFICRKANEVGQGGLKPIDYHKSATGDWKVALEQGTAYTDLTIQGPTAKEAGAAFDMIGANQAVAGFVLSLDAAGSDVIALAAKTVADAKKLAGASSVAQLSSGSQVTSHDKFPTVVSTQVAITLTAGQTAGAVRNALVAALLGKTVLQAGSAAYGPSETSHIARWETLLRAADGRLLIIGGVAPAAMAADPKQATGYHLDDLSNGTALATAADSDTVECDPFLLAHNPIADIIWVVDESGSMSDNQKDIVANASDFFARALKSGLDFRMAVTSVIDPNDSMPFMPPPILGKLCGQLMPPPPGWPWDDGGPDRFLLPTEDAIFKSCVANPPYDEGGSEYGLANAYEAVTRHLPRASGDPTKIRPEATLVVIIATDEAPMELKTGGEYKGHPAGFLAADEYFGPQSCTLTAATQQKVDSYIAPWIDLFTGKHPQHQAQGKTIVHLIGGLCTSGSCSPEIGHGYLELVKATGGITADICQANLGATLQIIIDSITGAASSAVLQYVPISASLAVAVGPTPLARSREQGFDYVGASNSLVFVGVTVQTGTQVVASYRRWVKQATIE